MFQIPYPMFMNLELTTRCNKNCWMCGRREREKEHGDRYNKDMDFDLVKYLANCFEVPLHVVQFHNNGEALLYEQFGEAVEFFKTYGRLTSVTTNGKLLLEKFEEVQLLDTLAISIIENDPEGMEQYNIVEEFLAKNKTVNVVLRFLGRIGSDRLFKYQTLSKMYKLPIARRALHSPKGSFNYEKAEPTVPELGFCLDMFNHIAVAYNGDVSPCVRFDPAKQLVLGNIVNKPYKDIIFGERRKKLLKMHVEGNRSKIPFCNKCDFWGVPTQPER